MADNLKQVSEWTLKGSFKLQRKNIELYLKLTRKDVDALHRFPLPQAFVPKFEKFCTDFEKLEAEFKSGKAEEKSWAQNLLLCAKTLAGHASLM